MVPIDDNPVVYFRLSRPPQMETDYYAILLLDNARDIELFIRIGYLGLLMEH